MIRGVVAELFVENNKVWDAQLDKKLDQRFGEQEKRFDEKLDSRFSIFKREIREEVEGLSHMQKREILDQTRALLTQTEKRIITEITEFIGDEILPQIDEHTRQIERINHHLQLA